MTPTERAEIFEMAQRCGIRPCSSVSTNGDLLCPVLPASLIELAAALIKRGEDAAERRFYTTLDAVEQIAAQAIGGYPWYKDDQKNFPGATEADGVCIGDHIPETIVEELANKYRRLKGASDDK